MYNVPLVFQLWENPQKKSPMKRRCAIISCSQNINYINSRSQKTSYCPCSRQQTNNYVQHAGNTPPPPLSFLFDTHSKNETEPNWRSAWGNDIKFSSQYSNSKGVAILFRNTFQYHIEKEIKDSDRNFIILSVRINDTLWTLVAVYGLNNDEPQFFTNLQRKIES